jgi:hypothetical protein
MFLYVKYNVLNIETKTHTAKNLQFQLVQHNVLMRETKCSVCLEMKAAALQIAFSTVSPMILAPMAGFTVRK